ncbi:hypothetical protein RUND412_006642 [Rhizina undulata]
MLPEITTDWTSAAAVTSIAAFIASGMLVANRAKTKTDYLQPFADNLDHIIQDANPTGKTGTTNFEWTRADAALRELATLTLAVSRFENQIKAMEANRLKTASPDIQRIAALQGFLELVRTVAPGAGTEKQAFAPACNATQPFKSALEEGKLDTSGKTAQQLFDEFKNFLSSPRSCSHPTDLARALRLPLDTTFDVSIKHIASLFTAATASTSDSVTCAKQYAVGMGLASLTDKASAWATAFYDTKIDTSVAAAALVTSLLGNIRSHFITAEWTKKALANLKEWKGYGLTYSEYKVAWEEKVFLVDRAADLDFPDPRNEIAEAFRRSLSGTNYGYLENFGFVRVSRAGIESPEDYTYDEMLVILEAHWSVPHAPASEKKRIVPARSADLIPATSTKTFNRLGAGENQKKEFPAGCAATRTTPNSRPRPVES